MADGQDMGDRAQFREMLEGTKEDWDIIVEHSKGFNKGLAKRVLDHLRLLDGDYGGFPVDRLTHSLQTATRAHRDGRDEEYVVCALLHDIGDTLGSFNHPDVAAAILKPFVSEANLFMVANHGAFQGYYFFEHIGLDKNMREQFKDSPHYEYCAQFCDGRSRVRETGKFHVSQGDAGIKLKRPPFQEAVFLIRYRRLGLPRSCHRRGLRICWDRSCRCSRRPARIHACRTA